MPLRSENGARSIRERTCVLASESIVLLVVRALSVRCFVSVTFERRLPLLMTQHNRDEGCPRYRHAAIHRRGTLALAGHRARRLIARMRALASEHANFDAVTVGRDSKRGAREP
jgi:hypothetical protein